MRRPTSNVGWIKNRGRACTLKGGLYFRLDLLLWPQRRVQICILTPTSCPLAQMGRLFSQKTVLLVMVWMAEAVARQAAVFQLRQQI